jgi:hypothetical protein
MVPGDNPSHNLALGLSTLGSRRITGDVAASRFGDELRVTHGRPDAPMLLIVDQAEEFITLCGKTERDEFLRQLAGALEADRRL